MGFRGFVSLIVFIHLGAATASEPAGVVIKKLRTNQDVVAEYCRVETGPSQKAKCTVYTPEDKMDVIYAPQKFAERIVQHLQSAYSKNYFQNLSKKDLFHGHFMAKGPQTLYASAEDWFSDVEMVLYHSAEYLNSWKSLDPQSDLHVEHEQERSFAGWAKGHNDQVEAAIALVLPTTFLKSYAKAGTIYTEELNEAVQATSHKLSTFGGHEELLINTCQAHEADCKPCSVFNMMFIMQEPQGRFVSPDGVRFEIFFHCRYKKY